MLIDRLIDHDVWLATLTLHKKWSFRLKISKVNMSKSALRICSHLLRRNSMENLIFCAVIFTYSVHIWKYAILTRQKLLISTQLMINWKYSAVVKAAHSVDALFLLLLSCYSHFPNFMHSLFSCYAKFRFCSLKFKGTALKLLYNNHSSPYERNFLNSSKALTNMEIVIWEVKVLSF